MCRIIVLAATVVLLGLSVPRSFAADEPDPKPDQSVTLTLPENVELKVLTDYVSQRLNVNILYDEQIANKKVTLKAPERVPVDSLMGLLESALKMKGLALVDADQPGWKKIVAVRNLAEIAIPPADAARIGADAGATVAVTRVFELNFASPQRVDLLIKPFLTTPGGNSFQVPEHNLIIVTDFATNMAKIAELVAISDRSPKPAATRFVPAKNMAAAELAQRVSQLLAAQAKAQGVAVQGGAGAPQLDVLHDERTNQVILIGSPEAVATTARLVESLDVPLGLDTRMYAFTSASPERVDRLIKELIGELTAKRLYKSAIDKEANLLIVTTTPEVHAQLTKLKGDLDQPAMAEQSPIRFYKLANATATAVLETIRSIEGEVGLSGTSVGGSDGSFMKDAPKDPAKRLLEVPGAPGANAPSTPGIATADRQNGLPRPPGYTSDSDKPAGNSTASDPGRTPGAPGAPVAPGVPALPGGARLAAIQTKVAGADARIMADVNTNTIIVVGPPEVQKVYAQLIERLDKRRPQVLLEATVVTLDTSGGYSFGVDFARSTDVADGKLFTFGSFGLSEVDGDTGRLTLSPGLGFTGALISADIADIIIRALKTNGRARVLSAPRILVNDNATGTLTSVNEAPFTSVNASDTVATTSFAGFASAGTTVTMTPHIAEGDHLQLEYTIDLSSFTGEGSSTVPPPRQTNAISSQVMIPDGSTIIVGGLKRKDFTHTRSTIPWIGDIPLLGDLIGATTESDAEATLFVFIRPVILRDDQFRDLKHFSYRDAKLAELPGLPGAGDYPTSEPMLIK